MSLTQESLRGLLYYNKRTGIFTWKFNTYNNKSLAGDVAGCLDKSTGYWMIGLNGKQHYAHRLACLFVTGNLPEQVDHIDLDKLNNMWDNLNPTTHAVNTKRKKRLKSNSSGLTGISWVGRLSKWHSYIGVEGKRKSLGYFSDFFEACCSRKSANNLYGYGVNHGDT